MRIKTSSRAALYIALSLIAVAAVLTIAIGLTRSRGATLPDASHSPQRNVDDTNLDLPALPEMKELIFLPTVTPSPTPSPALATHTPPPPSPTVLPSPLHSPARSAVELTGFRHEWQTWNNCGPATLSMVLSFFDNPLNQTDIGAILRPYPDDKNVSPHELVAFARDQGFIAQLRVNGNADLVRTLLSNGIPVMVETWLNPEDEGGLGHYRLLTGFDDSAQRWIAYDSYVSTELVSAAPNAYRGIYLHYEESERLWAVFNHAFLLVFPPAQEPLVRSILGDMFEESAMWRAALQTTQNAVENGTPDAYDWFNLGTVLTHLESYDNASAAFDHAQQIGLPLRMLWYQFEPFEAYYAAGRYKDSVDLADSVLVTTQSVEEIYFWKGRALLAMGDTVGAQQAWQRALALNPAYEAVRLALHLPPE